VQAPEPQRLDQLGGDEASADDDGSPRRGKAGADAFGVGEIPQR
jgi:hypothetical protein